jgi:hypothetical protein
MAIGKWQLAISNLASDKSKNQEPKTKNQKPRASLVF